MGRQNQFNYEEPIRTEVREDSREVANFYDGLIGRKDKTAQLGDAAIAFITMKKHAAEKCSSCGHPMAKEKCSNADCGDGMKMAGLISAAKGVGTKAMSMGGKALGAAKANPALAGAAVGAAGGAIAGGPDHRLGGAVAGAGLGAAAGAGAKRIAGAGARADAATAAKVRELHPHAPPPASPGPSATTQLNELRRPAAGTHPTTGGMPVPQSPGGGYAPDGFAKEYAGAVATMPKSPGARTSGLADPGRAVTMQSTPAAGLANQSPEALAAARQEMMSGKPMGVGAARGTGPMPNLAQQPMPGTQVLPALQKRAAWLPPFAVADDSSNAASGGESLAKTAFKMPSVSRSAIINIAEEVVDIGRRQLQAELSKPHSNSKEKKAGPYDDTPLMDMKQRAAERFPEKVSPIEAIRTDFKKAVQLLSDKVQEIRSEKLEITNPKTASISGMSLGRDISTALNKPEETDEDRFATLKTQLPQVLQHKVPLDAKEFRAHREKIAAEAGLDMKEMASLGGMPKTLMTPRGAGFAAAGALIGGGMGYFGSRGKPELGGKSKAEVELGAARDAQPAKPDGIGATIGKHVTNIHADVAEQMRKHPVAATLAGAGVGAGLALRVATMLGK